MLAKKKRRSDLDEPVLKELTAGKCKPGSIEQQLDMCEQGPLRGENLIRNASNNEDPLNPQAGDPVELDEELNTFDITMAESDREGDEQSGDEHSAGLQGEEQELRRQPNIDTGIPGDNGQPSNVIEALFEMSVERKKMISKRKR
jgi:hypothetical protein